MRLTSRVVINTVAFLVLSGGLAALLAVRVLPTVFSSTYSVYGMFSAGGGVASNQEVTYRGVQVGRVGRMTLADEGVRIEMLIQSGTRIPKEGVRAQVLFKSAVGEQFIDLLPESEGAPFLDDGDVIPSDRTSIPVQIEDLLRQFDAVLRSVDPQALGAVIHELGRGLSGHGKDLRDVILSLDALTEVGAGRLEELTQLVPDAADVQDAFVSTREEFVDAVASLRTVVDALAARRSDVVRTLRATRDLNTEIIALLDARRDELNTVLADLGTVVRDSHANLDNLDKTLTYLGPFLADAVTAYDAPYFVFNLVTNGENPQCTYDPSSRPTRSVLDTEPEEPETDFACAGPSGSSVSASSPAMSSLPPALRIRLERISWLRLFTLGY